MKTQMIVINRAGEKLDITDVVQKVTIQGDYTQGARKLECSYLGSSIDANFPIANIQEFNFMYFYQDNKLVFMGTIYEVSKNSGNNSMSFYAYDEGVITLKVKTSFNFMDKSVSTVMESIIKAFNVPCESYIKSDFKITKIFFNQSLYDIIMSTYTLLSKETGKKYMLEWTSEGKMRVVEKGIVTLDVAFEEGGNLIDTSYTINIDNVVNRVCIVDEFYNFVKEVREEESAKLYGYFTEAIKQGAGEDKTEEAKAMFKGPEKTCKLSGFGDYTCVTGRAVRVKDSFTGLVGLFYIDSDHHTWENGMYTIELGLNFQNIMNEMDKSEQDQKDKSEDQEGTTVTGGKEYPCEYTAYYPDGSALQGGYVDAQGNKLNPKNLTCAAPPEVKFGTKIQVKGTGTGRDGIVYKVTDRGGAIKIKPDGTYRIDLLMANKTEAYAFGRRQGTVVIGVDVVGKPGGGSATGGNQDIVKYAKTKLGTKYVWGATGPNVFDCSGLAQWCHKQVGINITRTSLDQSKSGKLVSKSQLLPGDLVFFKTTKAEVGHVGIYVGNGEMIHTSTPSKPCRYDKVFEGYYGERYVRARRFW